MQKKGKTAKKGKAPVPAEEFSEPADDQENLPNNAFPGEEHAAEPRNDVQALSRCAASTRLPLMSLISPAKEHVMDKVHNLWQISLDGLNITGNDH